MIRHSYKTSESWKNLNWKKFRKNLFRLQCRVFKAIRAGVMDNKQLFPTFEGVPQGGTISPLLANIALHGIENRIKQAFPKGSILKRGKYSGYQPGAMLIRYADDKRDSTRGHNRRPKMPGNNVRMVKRLWLGVKAQ